MATLLTTRKMSPELRARLEASLRGSASDRTIAPAIVARLRAAALAVAVALIAWGIGSARRADDALDRARGQLLADVQLAASKLTPEERATVARAEQRFGASAGEYPGDLVAPQLQRAEALATFGERPILYLRGPIDSFSSRDRLAEAAAASHPDALVLCLIDPPDSRSDAAILERARTSLFGVRRAGAMAQVERFHDALRGLPILSPDWEREVRAAEELGRLGILRDQLSRAPIEAATRAAVAPLWLVVMDEPKQGTGPTELDGACPHHVRLELIDHQSDETLLRLRRFVDPSSIATELRAQFAQAINSCELALTVRDFLSAKRSAQPNR